jgi:hypothetical protein
MVQAVAGVIPVAGAPLKAAVDGLLYIIQMIDVGPLDLFRGIPPDYIPDHQAKQGKPSQHSLASSSTVKLFIAGTPATG